MKSSIVKRSVVIDGHKTSVSLEDTFWRDLKKIARTQQATLSKVIADIDNTRQRGNLSSAIRLFVLDQIRNPSVIEHPVGNELQGLPVSQSGSIN